VQKLSIGIGWEVNLCAYNEIKICHSTGCSRKNVEVLFSNIYVYHCIHEEYKSRLNVGTACYHSVQNIFASVK
jgi:hypothetical protein